MKERRFQHNIYAPVDVLGFMAGYSLHDLYLDPEACIDSYETGKPRLQELCGSLEISMPLTTPVIKYGHMHELGVPLLFPADGQVAPDHLHLSIDTVFDFLTASEFQQKSAFTRELSQKQIAYLKRVRNHFGEYVSWGWQWEGPLTTAWGLLGSDFFTGFYDYPAEMRMLLEKIAESLSVYIHCYEAVDGTVPASPFPDYGRVCDDLSAMVSPEFWEDFVNPSWLSCFMKALPGKKVHCEGLTTSHLPYLKSIEIQDYDPGISPKLNPELIHDTVPELPFNWRLGSFHYPDMSDYDIEQFVYHAAAAGAKSVFTFFEPNMCEQETVQKVTVFDFAARRVESALQGTHGKQEVRERLQAYIDDAWSWKDWNGFF